VSSNGVSDVGSRMCNNAGGLRRLLRKGACQMNSTRRANESTYGTYLGWCRLGSLNRVSYPAVSTETWNGEKSALTAPGWDDMWDGPGGRLDDAFPCWFADTCERQPVLFDTKLGERPAACTCLNSSLIRLASVPSLRGILGRSGVPVVHCWSRYGE